MLKFIPLLLPFVYAFAMYRFSVWRTGRMLDEQSTPLRDPDLEAVTARLAHALEVPRIAVHVFEVEPVNGLAAPDGRIFLTRGFLNRYRQGQVTADEIGSVIAHELGHVAMGHTRRRMIDVTGQNAVFMLLATLLGRFIPIFGVMIARVLTGMLGAGLSRKDEHEADAYASALLIRAGIGTGPQKSLFAKLDALVGAKGEGPPQWLRSHPKTADRIRAIEDREARWL